MTLRARLAWGLFAIALVLIVPLLLSLKSLEHLYGTSRLLRDREFAASLLLGSFRERTDDARRAEDALLFIHDQKSTARMQSGIDGLVLLTDSLDRYRLGLSASQIRASLDALRSAAREEYEQAAAGRSNVAEMISQQRTRPAIASVDSALGASATTLRNSTRQRVADATSETLNAELLVAGALPIALLLALAIGIWLMRSISRPVYELERGMHAIAEGDLRYQLALAPDAETEFGRLAASYQPMASQLADLQRLRPEFVGVASHELTRLVKRLLDISRFEASGGKLEVRRVDLQRLLKTLESSFSVLAMQRDIAFSVEHGEGLPSKVYWDEDRINEVLGNLVSNAFKFTSRGGKVALSVAPVDGDVVITVADTGAVISGEQRPHIWGKFFEADNQAQAASKVTGLGLAIA